MNSTTPYAATGTVDTPASPIHAVTKGSSDSQNSRCRFSHSTPPLMPRTAWNRWWWLFQ